jgi:hypothetical protein
VSELLFKALESLRGDVAAMRGDVGSLRTEANTAHLETIAQIGGLSERLSLIDVRTAGMEAKHHRRYRAAGALMVGTVAALARTALLGK